MIANQQVDVKMIKGFFSIGFSNFNRGEGITRPRAKKKAQSENSFYLVLFFEKNVPVRRFSDHF